MRVLHVQHQDDAPPGFVGDRLAQHGATVEVVRAQAPSLPDPADYDLVVPLGCYDSAYDDSLPYLANEWKLLAGAIEADVAVFGICFGAQLLCRVLGGSVRPAPGGPEIGWLRVDTVEPEVVEPGPWLVWHLDLMDPAPDSVVVARTGVGVQAFRHGPHLGVQFHPEATIASARHWAKRYRGSLDRLGIDPPALLAETVEQADAARRRAHTLVDRVLARAGVAA